MTVIFLRQITDLARQRFTSASTWAHLCSCYCNSPKAKPAPRPPHLKKRKTGQEPRDLRSRGQKCCSETCHPLLAPSKPTRITHCSLQSRQHGSQTARSKQHNTDHTLLAATKPTRITHCLLQACCYGSENVHFESLCDQKARDQQT